MVGVFLFDLFLNLSEKTEQYERPGNQSWVNWGEQSDWKDKKPFTKLYTSTTYLSQRTEKSDANVRYWQIQQEVVGDCSHA